MGTGLKTFFVSRWQYYTRDRSQDFEGEYTQWRAARIRAILRHYGDPIFWRDKVIVEVGAGFGATGAVFARLGGRVFCVEGREENTNIIKVRAPDVTAMTWDLNEGIPDVGQPIDVLIHMGVLYHLRDPEASIRESCRKCQHLILETECSDSDDPQFTTNATEPAFYRDQSLDGIGSRPSPAFVERVMREEGMKFEMLNDSSCNVARHHYDWPVLNTKNFKNGQRRLWFARRSS